MVWCVYLDSWFRGYTITLGGVDKGSPKLMVLWVHLDFCYTITCNRVGSGLQEFSMVYLNSWFSGYSFTFDRVDKDSLELLVEWVQIIS